MYQKLKKYSFEKSRIKINSESYFILSIAVRLKENIFYVLLIANYFRRNIFFASTNGNGIKWNVVGMSRTTQQLRNYLP